MGWNGGLQGDERLNRRIFTMLVVVVLAASVGAVVLVLRGTDRRSTPPGASTPSPSVTGPTKRKPKHTPANRSDYRLPVPTRGVWHTYVVDVVFGRTDGTTARPGALRVWVDGAAKPAIDLERANTLQRYGGKTQQWVQLWDGDYTQDLQAVSSQDFVLTRVGRTLRGALLDRPAMYASTIPGQHYRGTGGDLGPPSLTPLAPRSAAAARIPASLGGNISPNAPLPAYRVTLTPNYVSPNDDAASNYQAVWAFSRSRTTPWRSPDSQHEQGRFFLVDPAATDANGVRGADEFWLVIERRWPKSFEPDDHGRWGNIVNFHSVGGDVGWSVGSGVSALSMNWLPRSREPSFHLEYNTDTR